MTLFEYTSDMLFLNSFCWVFSYYRLFSGAGVAHSVQRLVFELDNWSSVSSWGKDGGFFLLPQHPDRLWGPPILYPVGTG